MQILTSLCLSLALLGLPLAAPAHEHHAPHQGSLQVLGEEFAHLELVLDAKSGTLTAYALDGEAEKPVRLAQKSIELRLTPRRKGAKPLRVTLKAVANELTGESVGDSSQFEAVVPALKGAKAFDGKLVKVELKGQAFEGVKIKHPEGNE